MVRLGAAGALIGEGNDRRVYRHPMEPERCIKVPRYPLRGSEQNEREKLYFTRLTWRLGNWQHVPRYFGTLMTDQGEGLVYTLITDRDGQVSRTVRHYRQADPALLASEQFRHQLLSLGQYLDRYWIMPADLNDRNIVCQLGEEGLRLWLIDGIANPSLVPLANYWPWFARRRIRRRFNRFLVKLTGYELLDRATAQAMQLPIMSNRRPHEK
ncbi:PhoP regulatory network protein YrbL [Kushneria sinocarnis]|uniref:PhoP regulatory network protein YrbL n=1 Tax=Kushneria sinocarnis TaxID=595502 RepID=A0A420WY02_9GAMM|nr:YrbL family protein [Kushneria sinocarnis]RKR06041.1 PhoP regulatory network protein YrbL [Kushneria sinocarnis]